jgi:hypothetical protein
METSQDTAAEVQGDLVEADVEPEVTQAPEDDGSDG